jgi:hypothetical protein
VVATLDATLIETHKREALPCYKGFKAYQPLNCWWAEHGVVLHSEFRDGNVPAGYQQLRVLKDGLATAAATGITKVYLRRRATSRTCCCTVEKARFGVIEFSADVTEEFRKATRADADWQPLYRTVEGQRYKTDQEFAEVCFVPAGHSRRRADDRFLAIREPLRHWPTPRSCRFPPRSSAPASSCSASSPTARCQVIWWLRERCGKSEEAVMNWPDAERAVRGQRRVAHDPGPQPECRDEAAGAGVGRMKALRFSLINLPGRIIRHGRRLIIRVVGETLALLLSARRTILALAPSG